MIYVYIKENVFPNSLVKLSAINLSNIKKFIKVEVPDDLDPTKLHYKFFDFIGEDIIVFNKNRYLTEGAEDNKNQYRAFRERQLRGWDIFKSNVIVGIETPLTEDEVSWYSNIKYFTESITVSTIENDYPKTPDRIKAYVIPDPY